MQPVNPEVEDITGLESERLGELASLPVTADEPLFASVLGARGPSEQFGLSDSRGHDEVEDPGIFDLRMRHSWCVRRS